MSSTALDPFIIINLSSLFFAISRYPLRTLLKKSWTLRHRSHPYQNFSRIFNHKITLSVTMIFHLLWLLPILVLAIYFEKNQIYFAILSLIPFLIYLIKFGPFLSSE